MSPQTNARLAAVSFWLSTLPLMGLVVSAFVIPKVIAASDGADPSFSVVPQWIDSVSRFSVQHGFFPLCFFGLIFVSCAVWRVFAMVRLSREKA